MVIRLNLSALNQVSWSALLVRFALGGLVTVAAGVIADVWGPTVGGLFLAFPAIFCASATLIEKHERARKEQRGLEGKKRGTDAAALDAAGAGLGSVALAAFGAVIWLFAGNAGATSLALAAATWPAVAVLLWLLRRHLRVLRT
jgi:hypothetical protein